MKYRYAAKEGSSCGVARGNMHVLHQMSGLVWTRAFEILEQTDSETHRHAHRNTPHLSRAK